MARTRDEIEEIVNNLGYALLDEYLIEKSNRKVVVRDEKGYTYDARLNSLMIGQIPSFVGINNPFSLSNISLWLEKENKFFILCENNVFKGAAQKLFFQCLKKSCGETFDMVWNDVYSGTCDCPFCSGHRVGKYNNLSYLRPDLSMEWDYNKNKKRPEDYTLGSHEEAVWICSKCNHTWKATIHNRSKEKGTGCPKCNQRKGEKKVSVWLVQNWNEISRSGIINKPIPQKTFSNCRNERVLPFDFGLENIEHKWVLIEYHGGQHFFPVEFFGGKEEFKKRKKNDKIKERYCKDNNIPLLVIPY